MVRTLRRPGLVLALPALVGVSTLLHWLAGRRITGLWIMPDEAIYANQAETFWQHGPWSLLHGAEAGYGLLYPLVAGLPLSVGNFESGYNALKLLQALVMSLAAVPVFVYARRLMPPGYALLASTLTVCSPLLLYSGLVMTEVLFYPVSALALLAVARAVETTTRRDQVVALLLIGVAVATRVQAVVFLAVFAGALLLDRLLARGPSRLRTFWLVWLVLAAAGVAAVAFPGLFGAYSTTLHGGYPFGLSLRLTYYHLAYAVLMVAVLPAAAAGLLLVETIRGRSRDPGERALLAVTVSAVVLVTAQVGFFAARYAQHLLGRDLAPLPPLLFVLFALWLARGAVHRRIAGSVTALTLLALVVFAPWNDLIVDDAVPDSFGVGLHGANPASTANTVALGAAALLFLFVLLPRRLSLALPALVLTVLVTSSIFASNLVAARVSTDQPKLVGSPSDWIDRTAKGPVTYLFHGSDWNVVWQQRFWNHRVDSVVSLRPALVPGPMKQRSATVSADGRVPIAGRLVVADSSVTLVGSPIAHQFLGLDNFGLTMWRLDGPSALSTITNNVKPNGDMHGAGLVTAYDCQGGSLTLTLLPKLTNILEIDLNGRQVLRRRIAGEPSWHGVIDVPPSARPEVCHFRLIGGALLGSTVIEFQRPG